MLSTKNLMFKERLTKKLADQYISSYDTTSIVKLQLPTLMKIYLVVNISQVVRCRKQVERQKVKKSKTSRSE